MHVVLKTRFNALTNALNALGLELREDSALCRSYLANQVDSFYTAEVVADICATHKFLYEYTTYSQDCCLHIPKMVEKLAAPLGSEAAAMAFIRQHEIPILKSVAIERAGGMPEVWPWLVQHNDPSVAQYHMNDSSPATSPCENTVSRKLLAGAAGFSGKDNDM